MTELHRTPTSSHEEYIARVIWAAHIISYLSKSRSHSEPHEAESKTEEYDSDTDELSDDETDYETEKTVVLSGSRNSVRRKFLDCIAQLLSPCKGWDGVTATAIREGEDGVEVDVSRNDGFLSDGDCCFDGEIVGYCRMLEEYLAAGGSVGVAAGTGTNATAAYPTEFELKVIDYTSRRIDYWIEDLRRTLKMDRNYPAWDSSRWPEKEAAVKAWATMTGLILRFYADKEAVKSRPLIVQQAYRCLNLTQDRQLLSDALGTQASLKFWSKLNFIARPLIDCRLLGSIDAQEPQFRNCKILLVPSKLKTRLDSKYVVGIFEAWERLGLGSIPEPVVCILDSSSRRSIKACAETFTLHAEIQLVLHFDEGCAPQPTLDYFGCSKKTCLLCETILGTLPSPIATRGRHGVCYPAWGVPFSSSDIVKVAVERLEKSLVARIRGILNDLMHPKQKRDPVKVMQSGMVSDFSQFTLEEWQQKEHGMQLLKNKQTIERNDLLSM